jgi:N4-gp56 family major capsid protein
MTKRKEFFEIMTNEKINIQLFGAGEQVLGTEGVINAKNGGVSEYADGEGLSPEMRTYYSDYLIDNAEPALVHDRFAQKHNIPAGNGKSIQFRKYDPLPKLTDPIAEGITPTGQTINMGIVNATVAQYGGYVELTDMLLMTAIDNNLCMATKLLGSQAGRTLDTITREVLMGGTNVQFGEGKVSARCQLSGGNANAEDNHYLTVDAIRKAVRFLKNQNAEKIDGAYVAIIHPDCAYDLMSDPNWRYPHQYSDPSAIFEGEIGKLEGVRFIESTEAKVFHAEDLADSVRNLTVSGAHSATNKIKFTGATVAVNALVGREVLIGGVKYYVGSNNSGDMTLYTDSTKSTEAKITCSDGDIIYPGEAGACGVDVYATLVFGENAYGTTSLANGGLEHIVKQLGSAGSSDPLNQRATVGWKATKVTVRLVEAFMLRIETAASIA